MSYEQSDSIKELALALVKFHREVGTIKKDAKNPFFKSNYASLSNILDAVEDPLSNNGLVVVQIPDGENSLLTQLMHDASGEWLRASYIMPVKEANNPQAVGSAITYARRYALAAILSLNIEDDDAHKASQPPVAARPATTHSEQLPTYTESLMNEEEDPFAGIPTSPYRQVTVLSIEDKTSSAGKPFKRVETNIGSFSCFDQGLFDKIVPGTLEVELTTKGNYTNITGVK